MVKTKLLMKSLLASLMAVGVFASSSFAGPGPGPRYKDVRYRQDYSIRYYSDSSLGTLKDVVADRNGNVCVVAGQAICKTYAGRLLYPGRLVQDLTYRPLSDRRISSVCLSEGQLVYIDDKALFSNAWAGSLYVPHGMPGAKLVAAGQRGEFLVSDGRGLALIRDRKIAWSGTVADELSSIRYDGSTRQFWLVTAGSLSTFSPVTHKISSVFKAEGLTCVGIAGKQLLVGTHNGYYRLSAPAYRALGACIRNLPATDLTTIESIDGELWFGSTHGAFRARSSGGFDYFASERWLPGDHVAAIARGDAESVLVLTERGLARIVFHSMSLEDKAAYYEDIVRQRHIRYGFYSDYTSMRKGDCSTAEMGPHDSDNLWTSMYLGAELFRYLATGDIEARQNYRESFDAMERLFTLSGVEGLFGRCIERVGIASFKEEYRKNIEAYWYPGYARVPSSWHHTADKEWDWRGSSSSDQTVGMMFALTLVAQYSNEPDLKQRAISLIDQLMTYIVGNDMRLVDVDGRPTLWGIWAPEYVNRFPNMIGDKKLYSSNIIAFLQTAYHFTGEEIFKTRANELLHKYHYLENLTRPVREIGPAPDTADAWCKELSGGWNNSDDEMYFLAYWGLYPYALDPVVKQKYAAAIRDHWNFKRPARDGLWNLCYGILTGAQQFDLDQTIWELKRMPMDLITWNVHNTGRKDLVYIGDNILEQPIRDVLPPDERPQNKHNRNLFDMDDKGGTGSAELGGGDVFLLPYWMGRYFGVISAPVEKQKPDTPFSF